MSRNGNGNGHDPSLRRTHLKKVLSVIRRQFIIHAPSSDLVRRYYREWEQEIEWEIKKLDQQSLRALILHAHLRGDRSETAIADAIRKPIRIVEAEVGAMVKEGVFEYVIEGGRTERQRGDSRRRLLHRCGEPLGSLATVPQAGHNYEFDDDEEL